MMLLALSLLTVPQPALPLDALSPVAELRRSSRSVHRVRSGAVSVSGAGSLGAYRSCAAARAAGAAPLRRGQPGYSRKLDRDGDGVACE